ncbi:hypothetical protein ACI00X_000308 [Cronobacter turicensis]|uniref:hypothetical protein n=1 Tax=Cronobacter turicensis TaxID=413502 RepID=UPI0024C34C39|nr:hypothetical protein [Cronobacter turicensis]EKM0531115.1 hypothetical protein [Cronobacter turicensis]ELY5850907.1 hypothetical protein [Cronobacter turicensis]MDK1335906.1 hypothetical protein [Cronobacter turicensis]
MIKEILADWGLTLSQAITAIPVMLTLAGVIFKFLKTPFKVVEVISANKYVSLPLKDKLDALAIIYQDGEGDKASIYASELKLAEYGLHFRIPTLRIFFDYLYANNSLSYPVGDYRVLKHHKAFTVDDNDVPKVSTMGFIISLLVPLAFLVLSGCGFYSGIYALIDTLHQSPDLASGIQLALYVVTELFFMLMFMSFICEIGSLLSAIRFVKKLKEFYWSQLEGKYQAG